jgi:tetratricopeptide (TPR) repeat protein
MTDMIDSTPLYSKSIFIGREEQLNAFRRVLELPERETWILYLASEGGLGKTKLLEQFAIEAQEYAKRQGTRLFCTTETIDFYWTKNQQVSGVLENIAQQLSPEAFAPFLETIQIEPDSGQFTLASIEEEKRMQLFLEGYEQLAGKGVILLLFDTLEMCEPWMRKFWIEIFSRLSMNTIAVLAGRRYRSIEEEQVGRSRFGEILNIFESGQVREIPLSHFDLRLTREYLKEKSIETSPALIEKLHKMSEGRPIIIALACDWIKIHGKDLAELLDQEDKKKFQIELVKRICNLTFGQDQAILAMSHFYRRFDENLMAFVFKQDPQWARQVLAEVSCYSFVKYRKPIPGGAPGSSLLHDEMRRLIEEHVWPIVDKSGLQRQYWSGQVLAHYDILIEQSRSRLERFILRLEKLHYMLEHDPANCHDHIQELYRKRATVENDVDVQMITAEIEPYTRQLTSQDMDLVRFYQEWTNIKTTGDFSSGVEGLLELEHRDTLGEYEASQLRHWLATALAANGQLERAEQYALKSLEDLQARAKRFPDDSPEQAAIQEGIGGIYNSLGLIARRAGDFDAAIRNYELSLDKQITWAFRATVENNLSYALLVSGDARRAEKVCRRALSRRLQMDVPNELGLSYNVLGIILTDLMQNGEALTCFERALDCFVQAGNRRGEAIALIGLGRLLRKWGGYKEHRGLETFERAYQQYYQPSTERLSRACNILRTQDDELALAEALDELGCAYRDSRSWEDALECLEAAYEIYRDSQIKPKIADTLQNIAIVYQNQGKWEETLKYAEKAESVARETSSFYVFSKTKWTLGDVAFACGDTQRAFREYSQAGILLAQPSSDSTMYDSRAREMLFEDLLRHIKSQIFKLNSCEDVEAACDRIFQEWSEVGLRDRDEYAEFLATVQSWPEEFFYASQR